MYGENELAVAEYGGILTYYEWAIIYATMELLGQSVTFELQEAAICQP